jgi:hypothetical protein
VQVLHKGEIPDLWHIAQHLRDGPYKQPQAADAVLECWQMTSDLYHALKAAQGGVRVAIGRLKTVADGMGPMQLKAKMLLSAIIADLDPIIHPPEK